MKERTNETKTDYQTDKLHEKNPMTPNEPKIKRPIQDNPEDQHTG